MDLFIINRYLGDSNEKNNKEREEEQLNKLLQKIEERKKKKLNQRLHGNSSSGAVTGDEKFSQATEGSEINNLIQENAEQADEPTTSTDVPLETQAEVRNVGADSFTVIEAKKFKSKHAFKNVLPQWLANPEIISTNLQDLPTSIDDISGLDPDLVDKLRKANITHFFPVQCKVIPYLLSELRKPIQYWPRDVCVSSPTGSGKTLAFVLPIIQALKTRVVCRVRALVVLPVQELAAQVYQVFKYYCSGTNLKVLLTTGKRSLHLEQKKLVKESAVRGFYSLIDIVVTTPGRLVGHLQTTAGFSLKHLQFLVIDEADRIIDKVQSDWLVYFKKNVGEDCKELPLSVATLQMFPRPPQKLLFSATLTQDPEKLHQLSLFQPKLFTSVIQGASDDSRNEEIQGVFVGKYTTPQELSEKYCIVSEAKKPVLLYHLIKQNNWKHVLCFTDSQKIGHRLCVLLHHLGKGEIVVAEISAALKQMERDTILRRFVAGEIEVLVCTDALARGMDFQNIDCVISYSTPKFVKNYIHRVGRTGRAGKLGSAVTFVAKREHVNFIDMLRKAGKEIQELSLSDDDLSYMSERYQAACNRLQRDVEGEKFKVKKSAKMLQIVGKSFSLHTAKKKRLKPARKIRKKTYTSNTGNFSMVTENLTNDLVGKSQKTLNFFESTVKPSSAEPGSLKSKLSQTAVTTSNNKMQTRKRKKKKKKSKARNAKKQKISE